MTIEQALVMVKAAGYRVSKPKTVKAVNSLNAIGKPYGENFDPNYRMKHKPSYAHLYRRSGRGGITGISPERWTEMCASAKAHWDFSRKNGTPLPRDTNWPVPVTSWPQQRDDVAE